MAEGLSEMVYFYHHTLDPSRLEQSLRLVLQDFPMLCGRLRRKPDGTLSIGYSRSGVSFTVSECNLTMETVQRGLLEAYPVYDFIERINPMLLTLADRPLTTIRLTRMAGGGSVLGISRAHVVADGYSFYYFANCWSQVHEGLPAVVPWHDRSALNFDAAAAPPLQSDLPAACNGFRLLTAGEMFKLTSSFIMQRRSVICRVLSFSRSQLAAIKNAAGRQGPVSLNDALSAHLWQVCTKLQNAADRTATRKLLIGAGMRSKIDHPRALDYFGNAISNADVTCSTEELRGSHISIVAGKCRRKVAALDREYLQKQMRWLCEQEKHKRMRRVFADVNPYAGDCAISSLFRLPVYGACFDGHKPFRVGFPVVPIPWVQYLIPSPGESGGIDVYANLPRSAAEKLKRDEWQAELYKYGATGADTAGCAPGEDQECG
jgi:shikimate O-hydroxycinnamoyltransferase